MTFRRLIPCLFVLMTVTALACLQGHSFAQNTYPGNNPGMTQSVTSPAYNTPYQPPSSGGPMASGPVMGSQIVGNTNTVPPTNNMINRPLGEPLQGGPQPGNPPGISPGYSVDNPPQAQNGRQILPPPPGQPISKEKQDYLNRFLAVWQEQSQTIETLDYEFTRREYTSLGVSETYGRVKFRAPDKGMIEIDCELINGKKSFETNKKMKVICTGDAVYEYNFQEKKLTEFIIPAEQRGKGVMDSPLMILAGANPRELQERFYLDVLPAPESLANCICIQAWPKWLDDSKEFKYVTLAIDRQTLQAKVLLLFEPGSEDYKGFEITKTEKTLLQKIMRSGVMIPLPTSDEFDRSTIVKIPRDWTIETKNDFLPEASGQRMAQQQPFPPVNATPAPVSPQYSGPQPNMPMNNPVNNPTPGTGISGYPGGNSSAIQPPGQTIGNGMPQYQIPNNQPRPTNNQQMAMPPQSYTGSPSVIR